MREHWEFGINRGGHALRRRPLEDDVLVVWVVERRIDDRWLLVEDDEWNGVQRVPNQGFRLAWAPNPLLDGPGEAVSDDARIAWVESALTATGHYVRAAIRRGHEELQRAPDSPEYESGLLMPLKVTAALRTMRALDQELLRLQLSSQPNT